MSTTTRVAIVTGAAQGIGQEISIVLARDGYAVALNDLARADETSAMIEADGGTARSYVADVSDPVAVAAMIEAITAELGEIDVLVNNAGISMVRPAEDTTLNEWDRVIRINLTGPFILCQSVGRRMLARRSGSIVNIASVAGLLGVADRSAYNASKHGLVGLTRTLASEWGGRGVRVNAVCPGWVKTPMDVKDQASGSYTDDDIINRIPMARFASPKDIAEGVAFLADPTKSAFVNGHTLSVDGGWAGDGSWDALRISHR